MDLRKKELVNTQISFRVFWASGSNVVT
jgi:hypothetical protein